jgi:hypothetical protein
MSVSQSRIRLLVLFANYTDRLSYYDDWLDAFSCADFFSVVALDVVPSDATARIRGALADVDAIVLLHSTNGDTTAYLEPHVGALAERKQPLLTFVGNEVNLPGSPIAKKRHVFSRLRPEFIATQLLPEAGEYLFGDVAGRVVAIPHALNPKAYRPTHASESRPIDIGAKAARYLPHLGDVDRNCILDFFRTQGPDLGLRTDISDQRADREGWAGFLNACKGTVATEAGSWFLERDDRSVNEIREYVLNQSKLVIRNDSKLRTLGHKLPSWARQAARKFLAGGVIRHEALVNEALNTDEIIRLFFSGRERPGFYGKCISSRHFDAAGTNTCQIMFPGRFNDILVADRHYLALEPDFSNLDIVLERFRDPSARQEVIDATYDLVMDGHTYAHRMRQVYELLLNAR